MLRIVGMQKSPNPENEFVLIQNQGSMRVRLKGHALLMAPCSQNQAEQQVSFFALLSEEKIFPGGFVLVSSGMGRDGYAKTVDGSQIVRIFCNQSQSLWSRFEGELSILAPQHTFSEGSFVTPCIQCGISLGVHQG